MSIDAPPPLMTTEDLVALPDDGMERELIAGHLWERPMTTRNPAHSETEANFAYVLKDWTVRNPHARLKVLYFPGVHWCHAARLSSLSAAA